jgi:membrane protein
MIDLRAHLRRLRENLRRLLESPTSELSRWGRLAVYQIRLWRFCGRQLRRDRLITVAGDLAFKTLLGLIPFLVLFLMLAGFFSRGLEVGLQVQDALFEALNIGELVVVIDGQPVSLAEQIEQVVRAAGERIDTAATAVLGVTFLFFLSVNVLGTVESAMNRIWQTQRSRPLGRRAIMFWGVLTLGPAALVLALWAARSLYARAEALPGWSWLQTIVPPLVDLAAVWFVLFIMYKLIPNTDVRSRAALTGAVVAGTLWHVLGKWAFFGLYVRYAVGYSTVFGSLAVVPLFFLWVYVTWIFVLFGCELAYVVQNFGSLASAEAREAQRRSRHVVAADFAALAAAAFCARRFADGLGPTPLADLVAASGVPRGALEAILGRLEGAGILLQAAVAAGGEAAPAYLPGRPLDRVRTADVLGAVDANLPLPPPDAAALALYARLRAACQALRQGGLAAAPPTLADLIQTEDAP